MGSPKALLRAPDGLPFVVRIVNAFRDAKVDDVTVVTGTHHASIVDALAAAGAIARIARNDDPSRGQLSSLWTGMQAAVTDATAAILMTLVDVPMVNSATITAVVERWRRDRPLIVRPAVGDRHGHPVLFDRQLLAELECAPLEYGVKAVMRAHAGAIVNVPAVDEGCLVDVDTPEEYLRLRSLAKSHRR
jgi:CTP:molybdopterin cytidylyltransferase MocA